MKSAVVKNIVFLALAVAGVFFPLFSFSKPPMDMEVVYENAAYAINTIGLPNLTRQYYWDQVTYAHPPSYILILSLFCKMFGLDIYSIRLAALFSILITALLIYFSLNKLFDKDPNRITIGLLGASLYLAIPLILQGSVLLDIDNTLLPISIMIFVMSYAYLYKKMNTTRIILLGCLFALTLWVKITTSSILIAAIGVFHLLNRDFKEAVRRPLFIFMIGTTLFLATFSLYSSLINWKCFRVVPLVLEIALMKKSEGALYFKLFTAFKIILRLALWMSPYLILLWLIALKNSFKRIYKRSTIPLDFLSVYSFLVFLGYLYFGGSHVFPRYHIPMVFAICILVSVLLKEILKELNVNDIVFAVVLVFSLAAYYIFVVGDMLHLTNVDLKFKVAFNLVDKTYLFLLIRQIIFYFLPAPFVFLLLKSIKKEFNLEKVVLSALFILTIASNLGLNILQAKASYVTAEQYGTDGQKEVVDFLRSKVGLSENAKIITHLDVNYCLGKRDFPMDPYLELGYKYSPDKLLAGLKDRRVKAFAYNSMQLTIPQIKQTFNDKSVQDFLAENFVGYNLKTYRIWLRRK